VWRQNVRVVSVRKGPYRFAAGVRWAERYEGTQGRKVVSQDWDLVGMMLGIVPEHPFGVCIQKPQTVLAHMSKRSSQHTWTAPSPQRV
jgi:hypothetical protein